MRSLVSRSVGVPIADDDLGALLDLVSAAATYEVGEQRFRVALAKTHLTLAKGLWATDEGRGRAYELGNFLSDTRNRLRRRAGQTPQAALTDLYSAARIRQITVLIDNLQEAVA